MGIKKHVTSATLFERTVRQSLFRKDRVILFDQNWEVTPDTGYEPVIFRLAKLADFSIFQFDGLAFDEKTFYASLTNAARAKETQMPKFSSLLNAIKKKTQGLVVIHNAHNLDYDAVRLLARLIKFTRRSHLRYKFLLFADVAGMDTPALLRLSISRAYPKSVKRVISEREHPMEARLGSAATGFKKAGRFLERLSDRLFG